MEKLEVERINETHLPLLNRWADAYGLPPMPSEFLPEFGFLVSNEKIPVVAAFLYCTDSGIAFIENMISNPDAKKEEKRSAIQKLIEIAVQYAKDLTYSAVYVRTALPSLISKFKDAEFQEVSNNCSLLIRRI